MNVKENRGGIIVLIIAVVFAVGLFIYAMFDDATNRPERNINGDALGQAAEESFDDYAQRAAETLEQAPADQNAYSLITFSDALTTDEASEVTAELGRVNAMIVGRAAPYPLPEPIEGSDRSDVYDQQLEYIAGSLAGIGNVPVPETMTAVVAWDDGEALRDVAGREEVATVEVLPPDAVWGFFGVQPVTAPGVDLMSVAVPRN